MCKDVFDASDASQASSPSPSKTCHYGFFYQKTRPEPAVNAPEFSKHTFSIHSPLYRRASIQSIPDDGSVRHLGRNTYILNDGDDTDDEPDSLFDGDLDIDDIDEDIDASGKTAKTTNGDGYRRMQPLQVDAIEALKDLQAHMRGESRGAAGGYKAPVFDPFVQHRLEGMRMLLSLYTCPESVTYGKWQHSAKQASIGLGNQSQYCMRVLCKLTRQYIVDRSIIPINPFVNGRSLC